MRIFRLSIYSIVMYLICRGLVWAGLQTMNSITLVLLCTIIAILLLKDDEEYENRKHKG